jgi:outer membrane receptor protein involved in Fe transport
VFGVYLQDDISFSSSFSAVLGARVDKYDVLEDPVFSPRVALMFKPTPTQVVRLSYSRAYRAPSLFQNYLDTVVVNRMNLGLLNPALDGNFYYFPVHGLGNTELTEQTLDAYEAGYTASLFKGRAHAGVSFYLTDSRGDMILTQTGSYTSTNPPPGWPLPPFILDALVAGNAFGPGLGLPSVLSFQNLGEVRNKGVELSVDAQPTRHFSVFANYSYQAEPEPDFPISKINLPPKDRFNAGVNFDYKLLTASVSLGYTAKAYFRDVLDATYAAWTEPWTVINASAGLRLPGDHGMLSVKVRNLANEPVQIHPFGDLLRRQLVGERTLRP